MDIARIHGHFGALGQTVVTRHGADSQAIVSEDSSPPFCLALAMSGGGWNVVARPSPATKSNR